MSNALVGLTPFFEMQPQSGCSLSANRVADAYEQSCPDLSAVKAGFLIVVRSIGVEQKFGIIGIFL
jgi:hypothetical protein